MFNDGDLVQLKSGGPVMTVGQSWMSANLPHVIPEQVRSMVGDDAARYVAVSWFSEGVAYQATFLAAALWAAR